MCVCVCVCACECACEYVCVYEVSLSVHSILASHTITHQTRNTTDCRVTLAVFLFKLESYCSPKEIGHAHDIM